MIELAAGQTVECVARSTGSGRGFTGDCVILDEAQNLDGDQLAAILPMLSTRPNPQVDLRAVAGQRGLVPPGRRCGPGRWPARTRTSCWVEWSMADDDRSTTVRCGSAATRRTRRGSRWATWSGSSWRSARSGSPGSGSAGPSGRPASRVEWETVSEEQWMACYAPDASLGLVGLSEQVLAAFGGQDQAERGACAEAVR